MMADYAAFRNEVPVLIIDSLQNPALPDSQNTDKQNTETVVAALKQLSRKYGIPVIAISNLNGSGDGSVEYGGDVLIGMQDSWMMPMTGETRKARKRRICLLMDDMDTCDTGSRKREIQVKILKNRNGEKGSFILQFYPELNCFFPDEAESEDQE